MGLLDDVQQEITQRQGGAPPAGGALGQVQAEIGRRTTTIPQTPEEQAVDRPYLGPNRPKGISAAGDANQRPGLAQDRADRLTSLQNTVGQLGGEFDPEKTGVGTSLSFLMARSKSFQDMRQKFEEKYPEGDLVQTQDHRGNDVVLFREDPNQKWGELKPDLGSVAAKTATPQTALMVGGALATGGASIPAQIAVQAGAAGLGSLVDTGIEKAQGYAQDKTPFDMGKDAAIDAGIAAGTSIAAAVPGAAKRVGTAISDAFKTRMQGDPSYGRVFMQAAEKEGLPTPDLGMVSGNPLVRDKYSQAAGYSDVVRQSLFEKNRAVVKDLSQKIMDLDERIAGYRVAGVEPEYAVQRQNFFLDLLGRTSKTGTTGEREIATQQFGKRIDKLIYDPEREAKYPYMQQKDWDSLENLAQYTKMLDNVRTGGQLSTQAAVSKLFSPLTAIREPERWVLTTAQIFNNKTMAQILTKPAAAEQFFKGVAAGPGSEAMRRFSASMAIAARNEGDTSERSTPSEHVDTGDEGQ